LKKSAWFEGRENAQKSQNEKGDARASQKYAFILLGQYPAACCGFAV